MAHAGRCGKTGRPGGAKLFVRERADAVEWAGAAAAARQGAGAA